MNDGPIPIYRVIRRTSVWVEGRTGRRQLNPFYDTVDMVFFTAEGHYAQDRRDTTYVISRAAQPRRASYKVRAYQYRDCDEAFEVIMASAAPYCEGDVDAWNKFVKSNRPTVVRV